MKTYIAVEWIHNSPDQPMSIYSELDEENWETRKVEAFADGALTLEVISQEQFEVLWKQAKDLDYKGK